MRIKEEKYYLTLNGRQLSQLIEYLTGARNSFLDKNRAVFGKKNESEAAFR